MSKKPDKELIEQLMQSGYTEADAQQTVREISETEQFLYHQDHVEPSPQFMQRLETQLREKLVGVPSSSHADEQSMPKPAFGGQSRRIGSSIRFGSNEWVLLPPRLLSSLSLLSLFVEAIKNPRSLLHSNLRKQWSKRRTYRSCGNWS